MISVGTFGYIIGKKKRMMHVYYEADLLWQILVREIYILIKYFGDIESLKEEFQKINIVKSYPKESDIKKCLIFTNLENNNNYTNSWSDLLYYVQGSFINLIESGYILKQEDEIKGYTFILDFNKKNVKFYIIDLYENIKHLNSATIDEIMLFNDMPIKTYTEIITNMKEQFNSFYNNYIQLDEELNKLLILKKNTKKEGAINIEEKIDKMISDIKWNLKKLHMGRRVFYNRLKNLDLIDENI